MATLRPLLLFAACLFALAAIGQAQGPGGDDDPAGERSGRALLLEINGAIGPATSNYIVRGIERAADERAELVIIQMDTPGGLDSAMREIIKAILNSPVPVVTWVAPSGSRAASAGTYILYASHVAAMAPATNLGAATPVPVGGGQPASPAEDGAGGKQADDDDEPAPQRGGPEAKAIEDAVAYIRGLAERRGRNADWAERAVRESASLTAERAVETQVADLIASDMGQLLREIDGRSVSTEAGDVVIRSEELTVDRVAPDWRTELLAVITSPTVAYMLLLAGIYGLMFEGYNPGAILPGVVGAICLLLALYAFQVLPVNYAGLALIVLGILLMIGEVFMPSFGVLGIGGIVAFVVGSIILMDTDVPGFGIPTLLIGSIAAVGGTAVMAIVWVALRARRQPVVSGREDMIGAMASAVTDFHGRGQVRTHGELWNAESGVPVGAGQTLRVTGMKGLVLTVEPYEPREN
ncbi:MAG TPA: nodulation protein NfeD [Gammaproteobacteria bacterium]|nr:nodulation protein NfeD [Gammaproteobacteria bacterium]